MILAEGRLSADPALIEAASKQRLELLLYDALLQCDEVPARIRAAAVDALERAGQRNARLLAELDRVTTLLAAGGVRALPLKGPVLAHLLWDNMRLRRCRDIDILVPAKDVAAAVRMLEDAGFSLTSPAGGPLRQVELSHVKDGLSLDLHWNFTHCEMPFALEFDALWSESRVVSCGSFRGRVLGPEWCLVVAALYLAKSYPWPELVYLSDLARLIVRFPEMDWRHLADIAQRTGTRRICGVGLALVADLPGSAIPEQARLLFPADAATDSLARRMKAAAAGAEPPDEPVYEGAAALRRLRRALAHPAFRERPADRVRACVGLLQLAVVPGRSNDHQSWAATTSTRLARLAETAATRASEQFLAAAPFGSARCRPAVGTTFYPLDGAGVLLSREKKALFALSPSAAFVWRALQEGHSRRSMVRELAASSGKSVAEARRLVAGALREWQAMGLLTTGHGAGSDETEPAPPPESAADLAPADGLPAATAEPQLRRRYQMSTLVCEVILPEHALAEAVDSALGHLSTAKAPTAVASVESRLGEWLIILDRRIVDRCPSAEGVVPALKSALTTAAINKADFGLYIHAAMLRIDDSALLLPAPSHSGKTCLAAALVKAGLTYCTDETTLLDANGFAAQGVATALAVKASGWNVLEPYYPELQGLPAHRRCDGKIVKYLPPNPVPPLAEQERHYRVQAIVFPRHLAGGADEIHPLPKVEALQRLMQECVAMRLELRDAEVKALIDWLEGVDCFSLTYGTLPAAVDLILNCLPRTAVPGARLRVGRDCPLILPVTLRGTPVAGYPPAAE